MAGFGDVLRGLGSVLNPQVAQDLGREDLQANEMLKQATLMRQQQQFRGQELSEARSARAAELQQNLQFKEMELKQRHIDKMEELRQKGADARTLAAAGAEARRELMEFQVTARNDLAKFMLQNRQQPQPQMVTNEQGVFQVDRNGNAVPVKGPDGKPLPGKPTAPEKAMPASAAKGLLENQQNLRRAEQALALIEGKDLGAMKGDKDATGWKGFLPDAILQRTDKGGIDARAALADLGSLVIHDRSGAAVTAAEFPRLRPFIPQVTDDPDTVKKKLARFAQVYKEVVDDTREFYKASGYKVPDSTVGTTKAVNFGDLK